MVVTELALSYVSSLIYDSSKRIPREFYDTYSKAYDKAIKEFTNKEYKLNGMQIDTFLHQEKVEKAIKEYLKNPNRFHCSKILTHEFFELFPNEDFSKEDANVILITFFGIIDAEIEKNSELKKYLDSYRLEQILRGIQRIQETQETMYRELINRSELNYVNRIKDSFVEMLSSNDIRFKEINLEDINEISVGEKTPFLHELKTQEQINNHFITLPRLEKRLKELISNKRDLLFLGLPLCGKTSLLAYLAYESLKNESLNIQPIWLEIPEELSIDEAKLFVGKLIHTLRQRSFFNKKKRLILFIDNIHKIHNFAVAKELLSYDRRFWLVWGAARPGELSNILKDETNLWDEKDIIKDICNLLSESDIDYLFNQLIKPKLVSKNLDSEEVTKIYNLLISLKSVPIWFLIKIFYLIYSSDILPLGGYLQLVEKEPTAAEDIVRSIWPLDRIGAETIAIVYYLPKPSWEILGKIIEYINEESRERTLRSLRSSLALCDDSDEPLRATMYDIVREQVEKGSYVTKDLKERIWESIQHILLTNVCMYNNHDDLNQMWIDLGKLARKENKFEIGIKIFEIAVYKCTNSEIDDLLYEYVTCLTNENEPDFEGAVKSIQEILNLLDEGQEEKKGRIKTLLAYCLINKHEPDFENAIKFLQESLSALHEEDKRRKASSSLLLAECLCSIPERDLECIIKPLQDALSLFDEENKEDRDYKQFKVHYLFLLTHCLINKDKPDWENSIKLLQEILSLLDEEETERREISLYFLAYCLSNKPEPDWESAINYLHEELSLLSQDQKEDRIEALFSLAKCLVSKNTPDFENAIRPLQEVLSLLDVENKKDRKKALFALAGCLIDKHKPDLEGAIQSLQELLNLLGSKEKIERIRILSLLTSCLIHKPKPDWESAINYLHEELNLLSQDQKGERVEALFSLGLCLINKYGLNYEGIIPIFYELLRLFDVNHKDKKCAVLLALSGCLIRKREPDWESAVKFIYELLDLLEEDKTEERIRALCLLSDCLIGIPKPDIKNLGKVKKMYVRVLEIEPDNVRCIDSYAQFLEITNNYDKAEEMYIKALEVEPEYASCIENYAIYLKDIRKDYDKAEKMYVEALEIEPENDYYLCNYAGFLLARGDKENGFKLLRQTISFTDDETILLECWFYCYAHTKDGTSRKKSFNKIEKLIKSGIRSPNWNLKDNVDTALKDGHLEPEFLETLSKVISNEVNVQELNAFDVWLQNF